MNFRIYIAAAVVAIGITSCSGVRNCVDPQLDIPTALAGNSTDSITAADIAWMDFFQDPQLVEIIRQTLEHNRDFRRRRTRGRDARAIWRIKSKLLPYSRFQHVWKP